MDSILQFLSKYITHALGDKLCTMIGIALGLLVTIYADVTSIAGITIPPNIAHVVTTILGIGTIVFAPYIVRPSKVGAVNDKLKAKGLDVIGT